MSERTEADYLARRLLEESRADPDDNLRILSRQLLRRGEAIERLEKRLAEMSDSTLDLINANRDTILRIHQDGLHRIKKLLERIVDRPLGYRDKHAVLALLTIEAINTFHPMHGESWSGWPVKEDLE